MVVYDANGAPGDPTYLNGAAARARGLETGISVGLGSGATATASYTYLNARATDDAGLPSASFAAGSRLIRRPQHAAEVTVRGRVLSRATLGGSVSYTGGRDDVDFRESPSAVVRLPAYATVNLAADVELLRATPGRPGLSAVARVENLFNERYEPVLGFTGRRRGVFGGAKFRF
jgi:vitamin B12 transporter